MRQAGGYVVYRIARRLERLAVAVTPEHIGVLEGVRAASAVAVVVAAGFWLHGPGLSWAAFGAFWTCLADAGGPCRSRLRAMGGFAIAGAIAAWIASTAAGASPALAGAMLLPLIFIPSLSGTYGAAAAQVGLLVTVVPVVAIAYPHDARSAAELTGLFFLGCLWAIVLCLVLWRIHPHAPVRRAIGSVLVRLSDMTSDLLARDRAGKHAGGSAWSDLNAEHRRSLRAALERARSLANALEIGRSGYMREIELADRIFAGLISVGHELEDGANTVPSAAEIKRLRQLAHVLRDMAEQAAHRVPHVARLSPEWADTQAEPAAQETTMGRAIDGAATAVTELRDALEHRAIDIQASPESERPGAIRLIKPVPAATLRHAARVTIGVAVAYAIAVPMHLDFSYWATMATVVVLQPGATTTWPRSLERMAGSIAGGLLAAAILAAQPAPWVLLLLIFPLAGATIALRAVNYTAYVFFLTPLFILVIDVLQPAAGLPLARAIDNVIGSLVGIATSALLWPDQGARAAGLMLAAAVKANLSFAAAVVAGRDISPELERLRRKAGLASTAAEIMRHRMLLEGQQRRAHLAEMGGILSALRRLAGAATARTLASRSADETQIASLAQMVGLLAEAVEHPGANVFLPMPECRPQDGIDRALEGVIAAVRAYSEAFDDRPRGQSTAKPSTQHGSPLVIRKCPETSV